MNYQFIVEPQTFQIIWTALCEQPAKTVFGVLENLKMQVEQQEMARNRQQTPSPPPAEPVVDKPKF